MPALSLIIQGILAALAAFPQAVNVVKQAKLLIAALRKDGIITKAEQNEADDFCNQAQKDALAGRELPSWTVEDDPK